MSEENQDPLSPYAEIDISTTDFGSLLTKLGVLEVLNRRYRGRFRMPRILVPVAQTDPATGGFGAPNTKVAIYRSDFGLAVDVATDALSNLNGTSPASGNRLFVIALDQGFDGTNFQALTMPTTIGNASAVGAASTQLLAAGGAAKKYRIHGIAISAVATAAATDGVVSVNEVTSGTVLMSMRVSATSAAVENASMDFKGVPQPTANNAIQVTSIANTTTDATILVTGAY